MSQYKEVMEKELETVADMITQLDHQIEQLNTQKKRMHVVQAAFTKAQELLGDDDQLELPLEFAEK